MVKHSSEDCSLDCSRICLSNYKSDDLKDMNLNKHVFLLSLSLFFPLSLF